MLLYSLASTLDDIGQTASRIMDGRSNGHLRALDVDRAFEGLFLRAYVAFEAYLEELFFAIVCRSISYPKARVILKVDIKRASHARKVVMGDRSFIEWMPYKKTCDRAEHWLVSGRPFTELGDNSKRFLVQAAASRNCIAHASKYAKEQFRKQVIQIGNLPPYYRTPTKWLQMPVEHGGQLTRLQTHLYQFRACAITLYPGSLVGKELKN